MIRAITLLASILTSTAAGYFIGQKSMAFDSAYEIHSYKITDKMVDLCKHDSWCMDVLPIEDNKADLAELKQK